MRGKEVQKPSVSGGVFCILFVAVDKKYAAGDKKKELLRKVCHRRRFGDSEHRCVSRFPAPLGRENRDTSSKSPRFFRRRRRFGDSEHRRVSRFPAPLGRENRDTSSKSPRFFRHRRRFGDSEHRRVSRFPAP
ncbi:MAG: hypothetical protein ACLVCC_00745, partial [Oscillospiraceae bacterium]